VQYAVDSAITRASRFETHHMTALQRLDATTQPHEFLLSVHKKIPSLRIGAEPRGVHANRVTQ
jgi:hypothetical protein